MITISLCMIVKNEEDVIGRCLESVKPAVDEIIVVDTGSSDNTKEEAKKYTDKIYDFTWIDDFSAARNYSFSKASMEYCMWLDADDIFTDEDLKRLISLKNSMENDVDVVMMKYNTAFDESGNPVFSYYRERILKNNGMFLWRGRVHEAIAPSGKIFYSDAAVSHKKVKSGYGDRNLKIYERQLKDGEEFSPRDMFYYARELFYHEQFKKAVDIFNCFLDIGMGWIENNIEACRFLAYCFYSLGEPDKALESLLRSFKYDLPRAEVCCDIGKHFFEREFYKIAVFWYKEALAAERNDLSGAFVMSECYGYIPAIQLCVCYDRIGDTEEAEKYNLIAGQYNPKSEAYLKNLEYFKNKSNHK